MDQEPCLIKNEGNLFLTYTSASTETGACLYFYDLSNRRTCAKVSEAELFIDCYPHKTEVGITNIRYTQKDNLVERSVNFRQFLT